MKTARERFEDNYMPVSVPANNKKGFKVEYMYYGPWHYWGGPKESLQRARRIICAAEAAGILSFVLACGLNNTVNKTLYLLLSGTLCICAMIFELVGVGQFCFAKDRTTAPNMIDITNKIMFAPLVHFLAAAAAAGCCIFQMTVSGASFADAVSTAAYAFSGCAALIVRQAYAKLPRYTATNDTIDKYEPMK